MRSFLSRAITLGGLAMAVAGCAASNGTALPPGSSANGSGGDQGNIVSNSTGTAAIRFVHGSPDAGPIDVCVDGTFLATDVTYGKVSPFYIVAGAVAHVVSIYAYVAGDTTNSACGSNYVTPNASPAKGTDGNPLEVAVTPASNVRTSVVIAGTVANKTLTAANITTAAATALNLSTPIQPSVFIVFASPAHATAAAGYFNPSATSTGTAANTAVALTASTAFKSTLAVAAASLPGFASSPGVGIGFYTAATTATTTPTGCVYPGKLLTATTTPPADPACSTVNSVDASDGNNVLPYTPDNDYLLTLFVIDGPTAAPNSGKAEIVGAFDSTTLGY
jgi:hypothetical protein